VSRRNISWNRLGSLLAALLMISAQVIRHLFLEQPGMMVLCKVKRMSGEFVKLVKVKRALIFGLALSLVGLGPVPLSACALLNSKLAECATPKTQSQCDQMKMDETRTRLVAASVASCCALSKAPTPELQPKASDLSLAASIAVLNPTGDTLRVQRLLPVLVVQDLSPPSFQSLLCIFLI